MTVAEISWRDERANVVVSNAVLDLNVFALLTRTVSLESLRADTLQISVFDSGDTENREPFRGVELPVSIVVGQGEIDSAVLEFGGRRIEARALSVAAELSGSIVDVQLLTLQSGALYANVAGSVELIPPFESELS